MKKPILYLSILFVSIIFSAALLSTTISGICRSFLQNNTEKNVNVKAVPVDTELKDIKQASVKL